MSTTAAPPAGTDLADKEDRAFLGHPGGLAYLAFTEAWERFSFYGMTALVVLYMVQELLLPGHVEKVAGMATYRAGLEALSGPLSPQALASQTFGLYTGLVYFTPLLGGLIADRLLGAKRTVVIGTLLMSAGHFAMAFDQSFLLALLLLILGSGCLKGNIAAQVGHLYPLDDVTRRTSAFTIFSMAINFGAVLGPLACGLLAQMYGWHVGFGTAGGLMLLATIIYLAGQRHLPDQRPRARDRTPSAPLTAAERRLVLLLILVAAITIFQSVAYYQCFNVGLVWINSHVDLTTPLGAIPVSWFNSIDAFFSIIAVPPLIYLWARQARRGREPSDVAKIGIGAAIAAGSAGLLVLADLLAGSGKANALMPFVAFAGMGIAFLYYWPPLLALISRAAPASVNATMVSGAYLTLFVSNILMGWVGSNYERMTPAAFWTLDAGIAAVGALLVFLFGGRLYAPTVSGLNARRVEKEGVPAMAVTAEDVRYGAAGAAMEGRLFRNAGWPEPRPAVLVFPEGFGISDHTYHAAERIAGLGHVALACDLYGDGYFHNGPIPETQRRYSEILARPKGLLAIGTAAWDFLRALECVDPDRITAIGYCLGAAVAMELAFSGAPIRAVAGFHPSFAGLSLTDAARARGPIHLFVGAEDYSAPPEARAEFEQAMTGTGTRWRMTVYGGVKHSFTNPDCAGMGDRVAYDPDADRHSFGAMASLFESFSK